MLLGSKPLRDMTEEEMRAAIEQLQSMREALRDEAVKAKKEGAAPKVRAPRTRQKTEAQENAERMLRFLQGGEM